MKKRYRLLALIVIVGIILRLYTHFGTEYIYGTNGAYYLVQARVILETGWLGVADMPFNFYLQAGVSWIIQHIMGWQQAQAIMRGVKICDSVLPPLAAIPTFFLIEKLGKKQVTQDIETKNLIKTYYRIRLLH